MRRQIGNAVLMRILCFVLTSTLLAACSSSGSGGSGAGGSAGAASGGSDSGGQSASGSFTIGGASAKSSAAGSSTFGGASVIGGNSSGGQSTVGGSSTRGGSSATGGRGGRSTDGGSSTVGGSSTSVAGSSSAGGSSAKGGSSSAGASVGGTSAIGGTQNSAGSSGTARTGGTTGSTTGGGGTFSSAKCPDSTWKLTWGDDFEGAAGSAVDGSKWAYDSGPNWYNNELQAYTTGTTNASLDGNGNLVIEARKEAREGRQYTSARLKTEGRKTFTYGRIEGRMKLPYSQGMWPAFWMLGGNNWPNGGEIDIMENLGKEPSISHGTMHGPGYSGASGPTATYTLPGGAKFSDDFHVFAIEWETDTIRWYVDGNLFSTKTKADTRGGQWVFDHGFFIILNLAVGGDWPGAPDSTTVFPQKFVIDYVHVCQK